MSDNDEKDVLTLLAETHAATKKQLEGIDLQKVAHKDSGWRVRDIIGHLAVWNLQSAKSLQAYCEGDEYAIPDVGNEDAFNQKECERQKKLPTLQIMEEWKKSHEIFKKAVSDVPEEKLTGEMLFPWGSERGDVPLLVKYMCDHEVEHREEIRKAIEGG